MIARRVFFLQAAALVALVATDRDAFAGGLERRRSGFPHPEPRPGITGENVLAESEIGGRRRVREAYAAARAHPEVFDGVYCPCGCDTSMHHRSLLSCFESRQAIGCMACREEAELVARLARDGKTLDEIRLAVDKEFAD
jgi:uncharacterized protein with PCYCGC motif